MGLSKRGYLGLSGLLATTLTLLVVRDVYIDWQREGKPLWTTLLENAIPIALGIGVFLIVYAVFREEGTSYVAVLTRWQFLGAFGIFLVAVEVIGLQALQGKFKPYLVVLQMTIGGAAAGTLVGYSRAENQKTRAKVEAERDKFEALFDNAPAEGVEVVLDDGQPHIVQTNAAFDESFSVTGETPENELLFDIISHDEDSRAAIRTALQTGENYETELHTATVDGQRDFQLRAVPFGEKDRAYLLYTDITELENARQELEQTVSRLENSNDRLQQFAYVASHDLQEPARMVSSYVSLLDDEYGDQFDEEATEYMEFAIDGANRMQAMIDGLLDYSRVRTQAEEFTETDAETVLSETLQDLSLLIDEHDVAITHDDLPVVEADRNQLGQLFQNLLENAIEHGGREIHVGVDRRGDETVFSVTDDGPGIPANRQDRIFELFEQGSRNNDGTGIGLALCDRIVSRHGGEFWVESTEGEGSTFYFSIPDTSG